MRLDRWWSLEGAWTVVATGALAFEADAVRRAYKDVRSVEAARAASFDASRRITASRAELLSLQAANNLTNALGDAAVQVGFLVAGLAALSSPRLTGPHETRNRGVGLMLLACEAALLAKGYRNYHANRQIRARILRRRADDRPDEKEVPHG